jgi:hypothetical protein
MIELTIDTHPLTGQMKGNTQLQIANNFTH